MTHVGDRVDRWLRSATGRLTTDEQQQHNTDELRHDAAARHGLGPELAKRLNGTTPGELDTDAARLAKHTARPAGSGLDDRIRGAAGRQQIEHTEETDTPTTTSSDAGVRGPPPGSAHNNMDDVIRATRLEQARRINDDAESYRQLREGGG